MSDNFIPTQPFQNFSQTTVPSSVAQPDTTSSALDKLEALIKEMEMNKPAAPAAPATLDSVQSFQSTQPTQPTQQTVEQQFQPILQSNIGVYDKMMQSIGQKYSHGKPGLTELLQLFDQTIKIETEPQFPEILPNQSETAAPVSVMASEPKALPPLHDWSTFKFNETPQTPQTPEAPVPVVAAPEPVVSATEMPIQSFQTEAIDPQKPPLKFFMKKLTENLKEFGRLKIINFNTAN